jgi:feruloyl esterase
MHQHKHFIRLASVLPSLASATACSKEALTSIVETIPDASLNFASWVQENGTFGDATPGIGNANASSLPELCGLSVNIQAPGNTSYNFGLFLPKKWNQRFMATGNGGFGGGVAWPEVVSGNR